MERSNFEYFYWNSDPLLVTFFLEICTANFIHIYIFDTWVKTLQLDDWPWHVKVTEDEYAFVDSMTLNKDSYVSTFVWINALSNEQFLKNFVELSIQHSLYAVYFQDNTLQMFSHSILISIQHAFRVQM